jgi:hypothetical protein
MYKCVVCDNEADGLAYGEMTCFACWKSGKLAEFLNKTDEGKERLYELLDVDTTGIITGQIGGHEFKVSLIEAKNIVIALQGAIERAENANHNNPQ